MLSIFFPFQIRALNSHELLHQDRLILERLALKRFKEAESQVKAQIFKKQWMEERSRWQKCQRAQEILWQNEIRSKRKMEAECNDTKLIEARKKLIQSQEQLKWFIQQKQERADQQVKEAQRYENSNNEKPTMKWVTMKSQQ